MQIVTHTCLVWDDTGNTVHNMTSISCYCYVCVCAFCGKTRTGPTQSKQEATLVDHLGKHSPIAMWLELCWETVHYGLAALVGLMQLP